MDFWNLAPVCTSPGEGNGTPLQYSCLENPMDGRAWGATVHGVAKSWIWLSDFTFTFHFHALEKEMATYSSVLAWRIPGMGEPGGLLSMGSHRVRHNWSDLAAATTQPSNIISNMLYSNYNLVKHWFYWKGRIQTDSSKGQIWLFCVHCHPNALNRQ